PSARTVENIDYIEQLKATFPWATATDSLMFVLTRKDLEKSKQEPVDSCLPGTQEHGRIDSGSLGFPSSPRCHCHCNNPSSLDPANPKSAPSHPPPSQASPSASKHRQKL